MSAVSGPDFYDECERDRVNMLHACMRGQLNEVKTYIVDGKVGVDEADGDGVTALQIAAAKGYRHLVDYLIRQADASVDLANNAGMTPLLHACREGHVDVVTVLISYRANVDLLTGLGVSALTLACAGRHMGVVRVLKTLQRQLTSIPATPPSVAPTPFMCACYNRDIDMCGYLSHNFPATNGEVASLGVDAEAFTRRCGLDYILSSVEGGTGRSNTTVVETRDLGTAILNGRLDELASLIRSPTRHLGELSQQDVTPLMLAVVAGRLEVVRFLLRSGVDVQLNAQERLLGMTALMFAVATGVDDMVQLLLSAGANATIPLTLEGTPCALDIAQTSRADAADVGGKSHHGVLVEASNVTQRSSSHNILSTTGKRVGKVVLKSFLQRVGLPELELPNALNASCQNDASSDGGPFATSTDPIADWGAPLLKFGLTDDVLSGDSCLLPSTREKASPSTLIKRARDLVMCRLRYADKLQSSPLVGVFWEDAEGGIEKPIVGVCNRPKSEGSPLSHRADSAVMYSLAQRNAYDRPHSSELTRTQKVKLQPKTSVSRPNLFISSPSAPPYQQRAFPNDRRSSPASTPTSNYSFASTAALAASTFSMPPKVTSGHESGPAPTLRHFSSHKASLPDSLAADSSNRGEALTLSGGRLQTQKLKATGVRNAPSRPPNSELHYHRRLPSTTRSTGSGDGHRVGAPTAATALPSQPRTPTMRPPSKFPNSTPAIIVGSSQQWGNGCLHPSIASDAGSTGSPTHSNGRFFLKKASTAQSQQHQQRRLGRANSGGCTTGTHGRIYQELAAAGLQRYVDCFVAEEVDEETLHSLSVDEVKEILARHAVSAEDAATEIDIGRLMRVLCDRSKKN